MSKKQLRIAVSGSVGVGKTTFIKLLKDIYLVKGESVAVCNEPAIDKINKDILEYSINNPEDKEFNTHFQLYMLGQKLGILQTLMSEYKDYDVIIQDRDIKEDYLFFNQIQSKSLVYNKQSEKISKDKDFTPTIRIYIKTDSFETQRTNYFSREKLKNQKQMQDAITYLNKINKSYENFEDSLIHSEDDYVILINDGNKFKLLDYKTDRIEMIDIINIITETFDYYYSDESYENQTTTYSSDETLGRESDFVNIDEVENRWERQLLQEAWEDFEDFDEYDEEDYWD